MKKIFSILLAMVTVLCAFSGTTVFADDEYIPYHICEYEEYVESGKFVKGLYGGTDWLDGEKVKNVRFAVRKRMLR